MLLYVVCTFRLCLFIIELESTNGVDRSSCNSGSGNDVSPEFSSETQRKVKKELLSMELRKKRLHDEALGKKQVEDTKRHAAEEEELERKRKVLSNIKH